MLVSLIVIFFLFYFFDDFPEYFVVGFPDLNILWNVIDIVVLFVIENQLTLPIELGMRIKTQSVSLFESLDNIVGNIKFMRDRVVCILVVVIRVWMESVAGLFQVGVVSIIKFVDTFVGIFPDADQVDACTLIMVGQIYLFESVVLVLLCPVITKTTPSPVELVTLICIW